jgi:hypothetical protein
LIHSEKIKFLSIILFDFYFIISVNFDLMDKGEL